MFYLWTDKLQNNHTKEKDKNTLNERLIKNVRSRLLNWLKNNSSALFVDHISEIHCIHVPFNPGTQNCVDVHQWFNNLNTFVTYHTGNNSTIYSTLSPFPQMHPHCFRFIDIFSASIVMIPFKQCGIICNYNTSTAVGIHDINQGDGQQPCGIQFCHDNIKITTIYKPPLFSATMKKQQTKQNKIKQSKTKNNP